MHNIKVIPLQVYHISQPMIIQQYKKDYVVGELLAEQYAIIIVLQRSIIFYIKREREDVL